MAEDHVVRKSQRLKLISLQVAFVSSLLRTIVSKTNNLSNFNTMNQRVHRPVVWSTTEQLRIPVFGHRKIRGKQCGVDFVQVHLFSSGQTRHKRLLNVAVTGVSRSWDQPCDGFQPAEGMVLIIHGTPNLSTNEPKPGDQKVSPNGMTALPPSDNWSNQR